MLFLYLSVIVVPLLASSVSALVPPHGHGPDDTSQVVIYGGKATSLDPDSGACDGFDTSDDRLVAVGEEVFASFVNGTRTLDNPDLKPICGQPLFIVYGPKRVLTTVVGICDECALYDLALSPAAFGELTDEPVEGLDVHWNFE